MRRPRTLTAAFCRTVSRPGVYGDGRGGHGLALRVSRTSNGRTAKRWAQRVRIGGKTTNLGLGTYPVVGLAEARRRALANHQEIEAGRDPRGGGIPTFRRATDKVIALHRVGWKPGSRTESAWHNGFAAHVYPSLGHRRVDMTTTGDVLAVVSPIWHSTPRQAELLRRRISQVMKWTVAQGYRPDDPAGLAPTTVLPKRSNGANHHRALHHRDVDQKRKLWTIPTERMKAGRKHRVPLSGRALEVLAEAREHDNRSGLLFPGNGGRPIGHGTLAATFRRLQLGTVHGLRSSFRDWCSETGVTREVAEQALAHAVQGVERAYARSDLRELRRPVMEAWGQYITR